MSLQLIFVVETNKQCKSDWIYIKETVEHFYQINQAHTKLSVVYMNSKSRYNSNSVEKEIQNMVSQFNSRESRVIYCFDCDDYDGKYDDQKFLEDAKQYCKKNSYDFVWFCKDIEQVYMGKSVTDKQKKSTATSFSGKRLIYKVDERKLSVDNFQIKCSNIMKVLDQYLPRK